MTDKQVEVLRDAIRGVAYVFAGLALLIGGIALQICIVTGYLSSSIGYTFANLVPLVLDWLIILSGFILFNTGNDLLAKKPAGIHEPSHAPAKSES